MSNSLVLSMSVSDDFLEMVMVTAFDDPHGACWYWATPVRSSVLSGSYLTLEDDGKTWKSVWCTATDSENDTEYAVIVVDKHALMHGLRLAVQDGHDSDIVKAVQDDDAGMVDGDMADAIVQYGVFGEIVYG